MSRVNIYSLEQVHRALLDVCVPEKENNTKIIPFSSFLNAVLTLNSLYLGVYTHGRCRYSVIQKYKSSLSQDLLKIGVNVLIIYQSFLYIEQPLNKNNDYDELEGA